MASGSTYSKESDLEVGWHFQKISIVKFLERLSYFIFTNSSENNITVFDKTLDMKPKTSLCDRGER